MEPVFEPAALLAVDLAAVHFDPEAVGLRVPVVLVFFRLRDDVALALRPALAGKGIGEALHAMRPGLLGLRWRLTGLRACLGSDHVLGAAERHDTAQPRR